MLILYIIHVFRKFLFIFYFIYFVAENFESLVDNYTREHTLSPIPFGEIAESSPENKNGHTQDRSEKVCLYFFQV